MKVVDICKKALHTTGRVLQHEKPGIELAVASGLIVGGAITLVVMASDIAETNKKVADTKEEIKEVDEDPVGWSEMDETKMHYIFRNAKVISGDYMKACGPAFLAIGGGVALAWHTHATMEDRVKTLAAALIAGTAKFTDYRKNVIADQGAEKDQEYYTGQTVKKTTVVDEDGNVHEKVETVKSPGETWVPNSFMFDETNDNFTRSPRANYNYLMQQLISINLRLWHEGEMTENDMRDICGAERTQTGQCAGAFSIDKDGNKHEIRYNPSGMQDLINGTSPYAKVILEYDDGTPLEPDIFADERNTIRLF